VITLTLNLAKSRAVKLFLLKSEKDNLIFVIAIFFLFLRLRNCGTSQGSIFNSAKGGAPAQLEGVRLAVNGRTEVSRELFRAASEPVRQLGRGSSR